MATAKCELAVPVKEQKVLDKCASRIDKANERFSRDFVSWITEVGECLKTARDTLKKGNEKHCDGWFRGWLAECVGLSRPRAYQLITACEIVQQIKNVSTNVDTFALPMSESTCRELSRVPEDQLPAVWKDYCKHVEAEGIKPAAADLKRWMKESHPEWFPPPAIDYAPEKSQGHPGQEGKSLSSFVSTIGSMMQEYAVSLSAEEMLAALDAIKQYHDAYKERVLCKNDE